jgi:acylphosphatase
MRVRVFVAGRVQGVYFRAFTKDRADSLGLTGWVRNLPDGRVEALIDGEEELVWELLRELWKGPPAARVRSLEMHREEEDEPLFGFSIKY